MKFFYSGFVLIALSGLGNADSRTWTPQEGNTVEGVLISESDDILRLRGSSGEFSLNLSGLSSSDQDFVWKWMTSKSLTERTSQYRLPKLVFSKQARWMGGVIVGGSTNARTNTTTLYVAPGSEKKMEIPTLEVPFFYDLSDTKVFYVSASKTFDDLETQIQKKAQDFNWHVVPPLPKMDLAAARANLRKIGTETATALRTEDANLDRQQIEVVRRAFADFKNLHYVLRLLYSSESGYPAKSGSPGSPAQWKNWLDANHELRKVILNDDPRILTYYWHPDSNYSVSIKQFAERVSDIEKELIVATDFQRYPIERKSKWENLCRRSNELAAMIDSWQKSTSLWHFPMELIGGGYTASAKVANAYEHYVELKTGGNVIYSKKFR